MGKIISKKNKIGPDQFIKVNFKTRNQYWLQSYLKFISHQYFEQFLDKQKNCIQIYFNHLQQIDNENFFDLFNIITEQYNENYQSQNIDKAIKNEIDTFMKFISGKYGIKQFYKQITNKKTKNEKVFDKISQVKNIICYLLEIYHFSNIVRNSKVYINNNLQWWTEQQPIDYLQKLIEKVINILLYLNDVQELKTKAIENIGQSVLLKVIEEKKSSLRPQSSINV